MSNRGQHFISIQQYTININGIDYIERTEEWGAVIHFRGGKSLQFGEEVAKELAHELESAIGAVPSWTSQEP